jgi:hypothetical protein
MIHGKHVIAFCVILGAFVGGCAGKTSSESLPSTEADLSSSACPAKIEVQIETPSISSDDQIKQKLESQSETGDEITSTMKEIAPHLKLARADKAVTLSGTLMQACFYKTTRTPAGDNAYSVHFAKSNSGFSLRIEQLMGDPNELFINVPITSVSPTSLVMDSSATGFINAEDTTNDQDGSGGFSVFIGTVKVTAKIVH